MNTTLTTYRPSLLGRNVFEDVFDNFFTDFPRHLRDSTQGYPVTDIYRKEDGTTVMDFALAGFDKDKLHVNIFPDKRTIEVKADSDDESSSGARSRRIARRSFNKTFVNYDNNLDLKSTVAEYKNGLLRITVPVRPEVEPVEIKISVD